MKDMKLPVLITLFLTGFYLVSSAQNIDKIINAKEVRRIESVLASDEMQGRKTFTPSIDKAADFIAAEFKHSKLKLWDGLQDYKQSFFMKKATQLSAEGMMNNKVISPDNIIAISTEEELKVDNNSGYDIVVLDSPMNFINEAFRITRTNKNTLVLVNPRFQKDFNRLKRLNRESFDTKTSVIFVIAEEKPQTYHFTIKNEIEEKALSNVIGILPGKTLKDEYVVFSAHYDHLGIGKPDATGDSIYNGANDDASGTAAVIMLAKYFSQLNNNNRTLIFVTFTAEEIGGFGSQYFSKQIDPDKTVAMFNIEMIGTDSKWDKNSAYITGYDKSDFGKILQKNLKASNFKFEPDPYPKQNLFYRSDNATLAALGVPAHTISTSKMDSEPNYHKQSDEIETLDLDNMAEIIKAIAISSKSIISGKDTPGRIEKR
ncbi:MAG: M28 family peptidase [Ginsengibacter sp.]